MWLGVLLLRVKSGLHVATIYFSTAFVTSQLLRDDNGRSELIRENLTVRIKNFHT